MMSLQHTRQNVFPTMQLAASLRQDVMEQRAIAQQEALASVGRAHLSRKQRKEWQAEINESVQKTVAAKYKAGVDALIAASRAHPSVTSLSELQTVLGLDLDSAEEQRAKGEVEEAARQERERKRQAKQAAMDAEREHARQMARKELEEAARRERQAKRAAIDAQHERARQKEKE